VTRGGVTAVSNFASARQNIPCACKDLHLELCSDNTCKVEPETIELAAGSVAVLASFF
jgi:hypothetical protein